MEKKILIILFVMLLVVCCAHNNNEHVQHRAKRRVLFTKNSKLFFRLNGKDNVIPWNQVFAHGWAFRINFELPETLPRRHRFFFKREIIDDFENLSIMQGYSCVLKVLCEFVRKVRASTRCGIFCKVGDLVSRLQGIDVDYFTEIFDKCDHYIENCPYVFRGSSYSINTNTNSS